MLWLFAILLTLACGAVLVLSLRAAKALPAGEEGAAARAFYRDALKGIDDDLAQGRISAEEAVAARKEIAREVMQSEREDAASAPSAHSYRVLLLAIPAIAIVGLGVYAAVGRADLPAQPLATRVIAQSPQMPSIDQAVAMIEERLEQTPEDVRGWLALAPVYMQTQRYSEAAAAYRRILTLEPPTADRQTDLAEALMMVAGGTITDEARTLLEDASRADPTHIRSRFYLAGELTRTGEFDAAVPLWQQLLALATGEEAWVPTAREGLAVAQAGQTAQTLADPVANQTTDVMIRGMVDGLAARIASEGGTVDEWAQLIRSRMVLDGQQAAQDDLYAGLDALEGSEREALADFGAELGLEVER